MKQAKYMVLLALLMVVSALSAKDGDNVVVLTTAGEIFTYPATTFRGLDYDEAKDEYILHVGNSTERYAAAQLHHISFDDRYIVDMDSYKVPSDDDMMNPNLIVPDYDRLQVVALDTAERVATVDFMDEVPKFYVGSVIVLKTDTMAVPCYVLTHLVEGKRARITYRMAELGEMFYNQEMCFSSDVESDAKRTRASSGKIPFDEIRKLINFKNAMESFSENGVSLRIIPSLNCGGEFSFKVSKVSGIGRKKKATLEHALFKLWGTYSEEHVFALNLGGHSNALKKDKKFNIVKKGTFIWIHGIPFYFHTDVDMVAAVQAELAAQLSYRQDYVKSYTLTVGAEYDGKSNSIKPICDFTPVITQKVPVWKGSQGKVDVKAYFYPQINFTLDFILGVGLAFRPYASFAYNGKLIQGVDFNSFAFKTGLDFTANIFLYDLIQDKRIVLTEMQPKVIMEKILWSSPADLKELKAAEYSALKSKAKTPKQVYIDVAADSTIYMTYKDNLYVDYKVFDKDELMGNIVDAASGDEMCISQHWYTTMPEKMTATEAEALGSTTPTPSGVSESKYFSGNFPEYDWHPIGDTLVSRCDLAGIAHPVLTCPVPMGYSRKVVTSLVDGKGNVLKEIEREFPWEIKNFDATIEGSNFRGVIHCRKNGEYITETVTTPEGTAQFKYENKKAYVYAETLGWYPTESTLPLMEMMTVGGHIRTYDYMRWCDDNYNGVFSNKGIHFGNDTHLGRQCHRVTMDGSEIIYWQNLIVKFTSDDEKFEVTSLTVRQPDDKIE